MRALDAGTATAEGLALLARPVCSRAPIDDEFFARAACLNSKSSSRSREKQSVMTRPLIAYVASRLGGPALRDSRRLPRGTYRRGRSPQSCVPATRKAAPPPSTPLHRLCRRSPSGARCGWNADSDDQSHHWIHGVAIVGHDAATHHLPHQRLTICA